MGGDNEMIRGDLPPWNQHFLGQEFVLVAGRRGASVSLLPGGPPLGFGIGTGATDQGSLVQISVACSFDDWIMAQSTKLHDSLDISETKVAKSAVPFQEGLLQDSQVLVGIQAVVATSLTEAEFHSSVTYGRIVKCLCCVLTALEAL